MAESLIADAGAKLAQFTQFMHDTDIKVQGLESQLFKLKQSQAKPPAGWGPSEPAGLGYEVANSPELRSLVTGKLRGTAVVTLTGRLWERRNIITIAGSSLTSGVQTLAPVELPAPPIGLADVIPAVQLSEGSVVFVRPKPPRATAAVQGPEGTVKHEAAMVFESVTLPAVTIATWIAVSRQAAQDVGGLQTLISTDLLAAIRTTEESEILSGIGPPDHLTGLLPAVSAVATTGLSGLDAIAKLLSSLASSGVTTTAIVMNPADYLTMVTTKTTGGDYLTGSPTDKVTGTLWGATVVLSTAMPATQVLAGDFSRGALLGYRETAEVQISSEHEDYFIRNLLCVRAEERLVLAIRQPARFLKTTLGTTP